MSNHDIVLPKHTVFGGIQLVQSVTPLDVKLTENSVHSEPNHNVCVKGEIVVDEDIPSHIKQINLDGLTESQKRSVSNYCAKNKALFRKMMMTSVLFLILS